MGSLIENPVHAIDAAADQPSVEERLALVERVAGSEQFSRSARLRDFLLYVGRESLKEGLAEIHEQQIGAKVFGRPDSYDRTADNIVRVNATELRKRIKTYFATTGADEPLVFDIPRGSYKPVFRRRAQANADPVVQGTALPIEVRKAAPSRGMAIALFAMAILCAGLALLCLRLFQQNRAIEKAIRPWANEPAVAAFWTDFLDSGRETDVVLPDDSASVIEDITGKPIPFGDYLNRGFLRQIQSSDMSADRKGDLYQIFNHNLVTFGAVRAAQSVLSAIPPTSPRYVMLARNFTADEVKRNNLILVGGKKSMPWDYLFDNQLNFVTDFDYAQSLQVVRNRHPKAQEQATYTVQTTPDNLIGYATIAYLPSPSRSGRVIILAGTDSDATGAAAAFLSSEEQMEKLRSALHVKQFPYFEVLLKTSRVSGTFFDAECIAYRTYPDLH